MRQRGLDRLLDAGLESHEPATAMALQPEPAAK
jgi:hypothetical protein